MLYLRSGAVFAADVLKAVIDDGTAIGLGLATAVNRLRDSKAVSKVGSKVGGKVFRMLCRS